MRSADNSLIFLLLFGATIALSGCIASPQPKNAPLLSTIGDTRTIIARDGRYIVVKSGSGDSFSSLAQDYLGDANRGHELAEFNQMDSLRANQTIAIPLYKWRVQGIYSDGIQTIPILCYHRFGNSGGKMTVSAESFAEQMNYLAEHQFKVIALDDLVDFLETNREIAPRTVVLTIDDGYRSTYEIAYPILKKHAFHATVFLYTDFVGARDALTWPQMKEMTDAGFITIQPHTKTHTNLAVQFSNENSETYRRRIETEIDQSGDLIAQQLGYRPTIFAYPYGDTNDTVIQTLQRNHYKLGVTVQPGTNTPFAQPFMLKRTMIYGDQDIQDFSKALVVMRQLTAN